MTPTLEVRCTAPHPDQPGRRCGGWLVNAVDETVSVTRGGDLPPGCVEVRCHRCRTRYVVCPVGRAA